MQEDRSRPTPRTSMLSPLLLAALLIGSPGIAEDEAQSLRERLTEREDENRTSAPFTTELFGNELMLEGQFELAADATKQILQADPPDGETRTLLANQLEAEAFYVIGERFAVFVEAGVVWEEDLLGSTKQGISDVFVQRGEMWLRDAAFLGLPFGLEVGRLNFQDDRLWWWGEDLDAVRIEHEAETWDASFALAREIGPERSGAGGIDPEETRVLRLLGEASWDWAEEQSLELFALHHRDHSRTERIGSRARRTREDSSDATLTWIGLRASGGLELHDLVLGYWLDSGFVTGRERVLGYADVSPDVIQVATVEQQRVQGYGIDVGATLLLPAPGEPRVSAGFAFGSGDRNPDGGVDRSYRQSSLQDNAPGFGGMQRFSGYGTLLDPELSNLYITTLGVGTSLLESSSIDFVYHSYWQVHASPDLRDSRLEAALTGRDTSVGHGMDLILAIEESNALQLEAGLSAFRAGRAWGSNSADWSFGGYAAVRIAF